MSDYRRGTPDWPSDLPPMLCIGSGLSLGNVIEIKFGPPLDVWIDPRLDCTDAAKLFFNEVARIAGKPPPFPIKDA